MVFYSRMTEAVLGEAVATWHVLQTPKQNTTCKVPSPETNKAQNNPTKQHNTSAATWLQIPLAGMHTNRDTNALTLRTWANNMRHSTELL